MTNCPRSASAPRSAAGGPPGRLDCGHPGGEAAYGRSAALAARKPDIVVPAHCTGWTAQHALAAGLPDAFCPNSVGSRFDL
jgi:hypothetical protein